MRTLVAEGTTTVAGGMVAKGVGSIATRSIERFAAKGGIIPPKIWTVS